MIGRIIGTGSYIPEDYYDNHMLSEMVDTNDEWIRERTGIAKRHIAKKETTVSMAVKAAKEALQNGNVNAEEIDLIIVSTITSNTVVPSAACEVQRLLKASKAVCFDLGAACSGFVFAYHTAQAYMAAGIYKTVLLIGSECLSHIVNWEDRNTCILFGDGAGAVLLQGTEGILMPSIMYSDGEMGKVLRCESRLGKEISEESKDDSVFVQMDGKEVFRFAVKRVPEMIGELLHKANQKPEDVDWFVLHQANQRIIEAVAKRMNLPDEKFPSNIKDYGNTSSASIPILLDEMNRKGLLQKGQKIVLAGFGAGLTWGTALVEWS